MTYSISKVDVPAYLRGGRLCNAWEDGGPIEVPEECFAKDLLMSTPSDLKNVLETLWFWKVSSIPLEVVSFAVEELRESDLHLLRGGRNGNDEENKFVEFLREVVFMRRKVKRIFSTQDTMPTARAALYFCAAYFQDKNNPAMMDLTSHLASVQADLEALQVLCELGFSCDTVVRTMHNQLPCLLYLRGRGVTCGPTLCMVAARKGDLPALQALRQHNFPWDGSTCEAAAEAGSLDCLQYAHENGCPLSEMACTAAVYGGHLGCLTYAHEHGSPWDETTVIMAVAVDNLECLCYLHEHGCPWAENAAGIAATKGHVNCLRYLLTHGCPRSARISAMAATSGNLGSLRCAHECGCPWDETTTSSAWKHPAILKYLVDAGCPLDSWRIFAEAVAAGDAALIESLSEVGTVWTERYSDAAILLGKVGILQALHARGCPLSKHALIVAASSNAFECMQFVHEHGVAWDCTSWKLCKAAADPRLLQYAADHGCPREGDFDGFWTIVAVFAAVFGMVMMFMY